jgi:acyl-CoA hydrolase
MSKTVKNSIVEMIELVLPNDTNVLGNLLGGRLMHWIDIAAALSAARHSNLVSVTAAVDNLVFHLPIKLGNVVILKASVNRVFNTSMEVGVRVLVEDIHSGEVRHSNSAYLTFVSLDAVNKAPVKVLPIIPESPEEIRRYEHALIRREQRIREKHGFIHKV